MKGLLLFICVCIIISIKCTEARKGKSKKTRENKAKEEAVNDITKRMERFVNSWNRNDMKSVAGISSKDAVLMGQGLDTVHGRDAIYVSVLAAKSVFQTIDISINEIVPVNKKYAFHLEEWKGYDSEGNTVVEKGRSLIVWKKMKRDWYIIRHMFNYVGNAYR